MEYIRVSPFFDEHPEVEAAGWGAAQLFQFFLRLSGKMDQRGRVLANQLDPSWIAKRWNLVTDDIGVDPFVFIGRALKKLAEAHLVTIERDTGDLLIPGWERFYKRRAMTPAERKRKSRAQITSLKSKRPSHLESVPNVANSETMSRTVVTERDVTPLHSTNTYAENVTELPLGPLSAPAETVEALHALWDSTVDKCLPRWRRVEGKRRQRATKALKAYPLSQWADVFRAVNASPFLLGFVSLDWLTTPGNADKVIEGNYRRDRRPLDVRKGVVRAEDVDYSTDVVDAHGNVAF